MNRYYSLVSVLRHIVEKKNKIASAESSSGVLFSSGLIAGEGLAGIVLALLTVIHLEKYDSFIWLQIDGKRSVKEIADLLKKKFGDETEPLYPRISLYMKSLYDNSFVVSVE